MAGRIMLAENLTRRCINIYYQEKRARRFPAVIIWNNIDNITELAIKNDDDYKITVELDLTETSKAINIAREDQQFEIEPFGKKTIEIPFLAPVEVDYDKDKDEDEITSLTVKFVKPYPSTKKLEITLCQYEENKKPYSRVGPDDEDTPAFSHRITEMIEKKKTIQRDFLRKMVSRNFLLDLDVKVVEFASENLGKEDSTRELKITNPLKDKYLYKIKCTSNELFRIRPPLGYIKPGESESIKLIFHAGNPIPKSGEHYFAVFYRKADNDEKPRSAWNDKEPKAMERLYVNFDQKEKNEKGGEVNHTTTEEGGKDQKKE